MSAEPIPQDFDHTVEEEKDLLECLRKIGKGLIASGVSVGLVENTLTEIALIYGMECETMAFPNGILIDLGQSIQGRVDLAVQRSGALRLNQISELAETINQVKDKNIPLTEASQKIDRILAMPPRFNPAIIILGYGLSCIGLTLLYRPEPKALIITGSMGMLVGLIVLFFRKRPSFNLVLPVIVAIIVSTLVFTITRLGFIYGPANLLITPLVMFLPGVILTTGMIELASLHIISGSARLIYGSAALLLLFIGISVGLNLSGLPNYQVYAYEAVTFPWWAPPLGTLLFGLGVFLRLSGANRDLFWMLLVLYIAMIGQSFGEQVSNSYAGAFIGALLMALSSEFIARNPRRTRSVVSQILAFWFLVPGSRGLLSVTSALNEGLQSAVIGLAEMLLLVVAITLGVLLGTLIISPNKFVPVITDEGQIRKR